MLMKRQTPSKARRRLLLLVGAALAILLGSATAAAQTAASNVTVSPPTINRTPNGGVDLRQTNQTTIDYISYQDCKDDVELDFPVSVTGSAADLQVWASSIADCTMAAVRGTPALPPDNCWRIDVPATASTSTGVTVPIKARALVNNVLGVDCDGVPLGGASASSSSSSSSGSGGGGGSGGGSAGSDTGGQAVVIDFMLLPGGVGDATTENTTAWLQTTIELVGPPPPSPISVGVGDGELIVSLPGNTDLSTQGYYIFCYPDESSGSGGGSSTSGSSSASGSASASSSAASTGSGMGGTGGAGAGGEGGGGSAAGSGGSVSTACPSGTLFPGLDLQRPDINSPYVCGLPVPASATAPIITKLGDGGVLLDGQRYVVAVAAYDEVFNLGPVSSLQCQKPEESATFLDVYCQDGGTACSACDIREIGAGGGATWPVLGAVALAAVGISVRRERRRRKSPGPSRR
jgi:hypothetical protein